MPDLHQSIRLGERKRSQQHRIYYAEDRGISPDSQRHRRKRGHKQDLTIVRILEIVGAGAAAQGEAPAA